MKRQLSPHLFFTFINKVKNIPFKPRYSPLNWNVYYPTIDEKCSHQGCKLCQVFNTWWYSAQPLYVGALLIKNPWGNTGCWYGSLLLSKNDRQMSAGARTGCGKCRFEVKELFLKKHQTSCSLGFLETLKQFDNYSWDSHLPASCSRRSDTCLQWKL